MDHSASPSVPRRTLEVVVVGLAILCTAIGAFIVHRPVVASAPSSSSAEVDQSAGTQLAVEEAAPPSPPPGAEHVRPRMHPVGGGSASGTQLDEADGLIPDGLTVSVFDREVPAVGNLHPGLLDALRRATTDARADDVELQVNSGWRSDEYQRWLFEDAVAEYGSRAEAARWVATAETSAHVTGLAVDIGPSYAQPWLSEHGAAYGLCQIYGNEPWHFELRPDTVDDGCPPMYADPTEDPRMQT